MQAELGRSQTTKGIWVSQSPKLEGCTLILDLEGTDGRERGEDDTTFERQSALFALATADVLLINMWCHDVGREHGAGKPLLRTIFQENFKLFDPRKVKLLFIIRDRYVPGRTPWALRGSRTWLADLPYLAAVQGRPARRSPSWCRRSGRTWRR